MRTNTSSESEQPSVSRAIERGALYTAKEAAVLMGLPDSDRAYENLYRLDIPRVKLSPGRTRFRGEDLLDYIAQKLEAAP